MIKISSYVLLEYKDQTDKMIIMSDIIFFLLIQFET